MFSFVSFIFNYFLEVCFLRRDREGVELDGREGEDELRGEEKRGDCNQDTLCEEKAIFNK